MFNLGLELKRTLNIDQTVSFNILIYVHVITLYVYVFVMLFHFYLASLRYFPLSGQMCTQIQLLSYNKNQQLNIGSLNVNSISKV